MWVFPPSHADFCSALCRKLLGPLFREFLVVDWMPTQPCATGRRGRLAGALQVLKAAGCRSGKMQFRHVWKPGVLCILFWELISQRKEVRFWDKMATEPTGLIAGSGRTQGGPVPPGADSCYLDLFGEASWSSWLVVDGRKRDWQEGGRGLPW